MTERSILPKEVENIIISLKNEKWETHNLKTLVRNPLIREDAFVLLDKFCVAIYYPIKDGNHGFHITNIPLKSGKLETFVFINTAQTVEKQVFTAAHELGHIWKVDKYVKNRIPLDEYDDVQEKIINRFAATLLMPEEEFRTAFEEQLKLFKKDVEGITIANMLKLLSVLTMLFFVPMKSVIYRCVELDIITIKTANILLGEHPLLDKEIIDKKVKEIYTELGCKRFLESEERKWIDNFAEMLVKAEKEQCVSQSKIDALRNKFGFKQQLNVDEMNNVVSIGAQEGNEEQ